MPDTDPPPSAFADAPVPDHGGAVGDLALLVEPTADRDRLRGRGEIVPEMFVPGSSVVRTSVLATWADTVTGLLAGVAVHPGITVTLDLELHLQRPLVGTGPVELEATVAKVGRRVTVVQLTVTGGTDAAPLAVGTASFMASPDPSHQAPEGGFLSQRPPTGRRLDRPFAERAGLTSTEPGTAEVPWCTDNRNATGSINGGLVALVAEEATRTARPGALVWSMSVRYLRAFRHEAARATATVVDDVATIDITGTDTGRLGALVTARLGPLPPT